MGLTSVDSAIEQCLKQCLPQGALGAVTGDTERYLDCLIECLGGILITEAVGKWKWRKLLEEQSPKIKKLFQQLDQIKEKWLKSRAGDVINKTTGGGKLKKVMDYPSELEDSTIEELIKLLKDKDPEKARKARKMLKLIEQAERLIEKGKNGNLKTLLPDPLAAPETIPLVEEFLDQQAWSLALRELSSVMEACGDWPAPSSLLLLHAELMMLSDDEFGLEEIEARLRLAVAADPGNVRASLELGHFLDGWLDRVDDARERLQQGLMQALNDLREAYRALCVTAIDSREFEELRKQPLRAFPELETELQPPIWILPALHIYQLVTDKRRVVKNDTPPAGTGNEEAFERHKKSVEAVGGYTLVPPRTGSNCHGYTFDKGGSVIVETEVRDTILPDNYTQVKIKDSEQARVCDVIVYGSPLSDHSGLVVEVDKQGKPVKVISKWGSSGGVFVHPPEAGPYGSDWEIYRRNMDKFDDSRKELLERLKRAYDDEAAKGSNTPQAHLKALELCRTKNALTRS